MAEPIINSSALREPRNRQLLIIIGVALLALVIMAAIWQSSGTRGAKRDLASATDKVADKQREVDEARRVLEQKLAELRAVRADADVQATKLGATVNEQVTGAVNDARLNTDEYYVRNSRGEFVRVVRP
jgi:F0F1-type ATP synthase membrane subunit b/b'